MDSKKGEDGSSVYFTLPSTEQQRVSSQGGTAVGKLPSLNVGSLSLNVADSLQIATLVCSTKLTHNGKCDSNCYIMHFFVSRAQCQMHKDNRNFKICL
jgi:hypothetical protein